MPRFDLVVAGGRVIDPETGLDQVGDVGIRGGSIAAVGPEPLAGETRLDATGRYGLAAIFPVGPETAASGLFAQPTDPVAHGQLHQHL